MKRFLLALLLLVGLTVSCSPGFAPAGASAHVCAPNALFCDNFKGTQLDTSKWQPNWYGSSNTSVTKPVNGAERACYDPANSTVNKGKLLMALTAHSCTVGGTTYPETTGSVSTLHSFSFTTGILKTRAYLPGSATALYNWAAIWTDGFPTWPNNGENDVLETLNGKACFHYHSPSGGPGSCVTMGGGWHDFETDVHDGIAEYFYDGVKVGQLSAIMKPHFIILGNQSGSYGGQDVAAVMKVKFVEVDPWVAP